MPGYEVKLGLGLHLGTCIEGAIGSYYKIDPTYLSNNVKMAERLESSTKKFGVPLLISENLWKSFSRTTKNMCRTVDYVEFESMPKPIKLYTIDVNPENIEHEDE